MSNELTVVLRDGSGITFQDVETEGNGIISLDGTLVLRFVAQRVNYTFNFDAVESVAFSESEDDDSK